MFAVLNVVEVGEVEFGIIKRILRENTRANLGKRYNNHPDPRLAVLPGDYEVRPVAFNHETPVSVDMIKR